MVRFNLVWRLLNFEQLVIRLDNTFVGCKNQLWYVTTLAVQSLIFDISPDAHWTSILMIDQAALHKIFLED